MTYEQRDIKNILSHEAQSKLIKCREKKTFCLMTTHFLLIRYIQLLFILLELPWKKRPKGKNRRVNLKS